MTTEEKRRRLKRAIGMVRVSKPIHMPSIERIAAKFGYAPKYLYNEVARARRRTAQEPAK